MPPNPEPRSIQSHLKQKNLNPTVFWRIAEDIPQPLNIGLTVTSIALPLLLWWLVTTFANVDPKFLPSPGKVLEAFGRLWNTRELLKDTVASLWRGGGGFLFALGFCIPIGGLVGRFPRIDR